MQKNNTRFLFILLLCLLFFFYLLPIFAFNAGKKDFTNKKYVNAFKTLSFAYHLKKDNQNYRYYYVQTLINLKPVLKVQRDIFEISQSKIDDTARHIALKKVNEWRSNVNYNIGNNYIYNTPSERGVMRWDTAKFPLKVAIINTDAVPGYYRAEILTSLEQWSNAVDFLKFEIVNKPSSANIVIKIAPLPKGVCSNGVCQYIVGFTVPTIKNGLLKQMTITLYDKNSSGEYFSDKELFNTVMHEMGHALGIMGHSYYEGDLMFVSTTSSNALDYTRSGNSFLYLTSSDINTLKLLYKLIPDISNTYVEDLNPAGLIYAPIVIGSSNELKLRKLHEAEAYIEQAPMISSGYVDLGIAYSELGDNENAVKSFQKALNLAKSDAELYLVYYNLAIQYASMKKKSKALKYAQQAQKINPTDEVLELISKLKS